MDKMIEMGFKRRVHYDIELFDGIIGIHKKTEPLIQNYEPNTTTPTLKQRIGNRKTVTLNKP